MYKHVLSVYTTRICIVYKHKQIGFRLSDDHLNLIIIIALLVEYDNIWHFTEVKCPSDDH